MTPSLGATFCRSMWGSAVTAAALSWPIAAQAQTQPPEAAPAPPAAQPAPPATGPSPSPGEPPPGGPPPLAESPLTQEQSAEPPPPAYPSEPPPPEPTLEPEPVPEPDDSERGSSAGIFARGSKRLSILLGTGSSVTDTYLILGAGIGYFLVDGLEIGVDYDIWFLADPVLNRLSPETKYVFHMVPVVKPYIGAFYRHTFVADYDDFDYVGGRLGAYIIPSRSRMYVGAGAVYEHELECEDSAFVECDSVYPEIAFGITF
ncbi:MAG TPA: hypothetical protein VGK73_09985 [Polyangiaceae bacterium]